MMRHACQYFGLRRGLKAVEYPSFHLLAEPEGRASIREDMEVIYCCFL